MLNLLRKYFSTFQVKNFHLFFDFIVFCLLMQMSVKVAATDNSSANRHSDLSLLFSIVFLLFCHNSCKNMDANLIFVLPSDFYSRTQDPRRYFCVIPGTPVFRNKWLLLAIFLSVLLRNIVMALFSISLLIY